MFCLQMVEESTPAVNVEQANISALMDALQNVGYHLGTGNQQIIINADGNAMVVDQQVGRRRVGRDALMRIILWLCQAFILFV